MNLLGQKIQVALSQQFPELGLNCVQSGIEVNHFVLSGDRTFYRVQCWQYIQHDQLRWAIELDYDETILAYWTEDLPSALFPPLVWGMGLQPDEWIDAAASSQIRYQMILETVRSELFDKKI